MNHLYILRVTSIFSSHVEINTPLIMFYVFFGFVPFFLLPFCVPLMITTCGFSRCLQGVYIMYRYSCDMIWTVGVGSYIDRLIDRLIVINYLIFVGFACCTYTLMHTHTYV
jgi:hypothetical protein